MLEEINQKVSLATRWSAITELMAKLVSPISSMILARLLTPEAFGVITTINLIISFADIFTDAGFQKYLVQHEFASNEEKFNNANVAFWSNLALSMFLWGIIGLFRDELAALVGNPGLGNVLVIACISLPLTSFSSIQKALYQRALNFKTLFIVRLAGICVPLFVTVPLAYITKSYWALIIGMIATNLSNAIVLTICSEWKPRFYYRFSILKEMLSFSCWTLVEQITIWLSTYIGTFIVGRYLSTYYLGLYKTSMTTVNQFTTLITAATAPVLFSSLSRLQDDEGAFQNMFLRFQRLVGSIAIPLCVGMFLYRKLVVQILLGDQWTEATFFIGIWALSGAVVIVGQYCSEVYRAKGKPRLSTAVQCLFLAISIPALMWGSKGSFDRLAITQTIVRLGLILIHLVFMKVYFRFSLFKLIKNLLPCYFASGIMFVVGTILQMLSHNIIWLFTSIAVCVLAYFLILALFRQYREEIILSSIKKVTAKLRISKGDNNGNENISK